METLNLILFTVMLVGIEMSEAAEQQRCITGKAVSWSLSHLTNTSGHSVLIGELQQPEEAAWHMHVDLRSSCGASSRTQVVSFNLTGASGKAPAPVRVPPGYVLREGFGYFRPATHALEWAAARDACARDGATLAFADSQEEALMLIREFNFDIPGSHVKHVAWYGASDLAEEGKYVTVTGVSLDDTGFASFTPGCPNGKTAENCIFINKQNQLLDDGGCPVPLAFICKVPF